MLTCREEGQAMVEYALLVVLIALAALAMLVLTGPLISVIFSQVNSALGPGTSGGGGRPGCM